MLRERFLFIALKKHLKTLNPIQKRKLLSSPLRSGRWACPRSSFGSVMQRSKQDCGHLQRGQAHLPDLRGWVWHLIKLHLEILQVRSRHSIRSRKASLINKATQFTSQVRKVGLPPLFVWIGNAKI